MMRRMWMVIVLLLLPLTVQAQSGDGSRETQLRELLQLVEQGMVQDAREQRERINRFIEQRNEQDQMLEQRQARLAELEAQTETLEGRFETNETEIAELETRLDDRLGTLKELFGVLQQTASDFKGVVAASPTSSQYTDRVDFLESLIDKAGSSSRLPSIGELERLWYEMQQEMVASGEVARYPANVVADNGETNEQSVVRVGTFNVVSDGQYLRWEPETSQLVQLPRQPGARYTAQAEDFSQASAGELSDFWVDPSGGSLLSLLIQAPELKDRINQGGVIGYIIIGIGAFALLLALERLISLGLLTMKVQRQARTDQASPKNPLGRVMQTYQDHRNKDTETLELKLGESIARETPKLTRFLPLLKIIAVVAPLLGLLGTVTGMINTFQAITLFGTGDPKLMAGGISQALVTTVMGLAVAIPTVLLHTVVSGRSKRLLQILEERSIGIIARRDEQQGQTA
ncbi:outer membrane transport energization protein ExbB [Tamilnaduibacter salinus]|uniref:Energy transducer TonB n=1 Tax=Tamilnaduibacter salinus TaxID=1484056 RepID=A0A2A2I4A1_9GAMM|nr:MotA/TolQ/ExbB proton channel family protein [Tamilnaduibacter salinus]PAV26126.1 energy transducer TonB [Tamilnaduibacter salinus]PVY77366.1 outer membrane transport energization protein ExbB [Tamilnaduibacter salinus]